MISLSEADNVAGNSSNGGCNSAHRIAVGARTSGNFIPYGCRPKEQQQEEGEAIGVGERAPPLIGHPPEQFVMCVNDAPHHRAAVTDACVTHFSDVVAQLDELLEAVRSCQREGKEIAEHSLFKSSRVFQEEVGNEGQQRRRFGVALDIDGVLARGNREAIHGSREAVQLLMACEVPLVFLTNGTGVTEARKAASLSRLLSGQTAPTASTSPLLVCRHKYADKRVLVVGAPSLREVLEGYGLKRVTMVHEFQEAHPELVPNRWRTRPWPTVKSKEEGGTPLAEEDPFECVMILDETDDALNDAQVIIDVVTAHGGKIGAPVTSEQSVPIYITADDFFWPAEYPFPRLEGCGCFREMINAAYETLTGSHLHFTFCGKPRRVVSRFAHMKLIAMRNSKSKSEKKEKEEEEEEEDHEGQEELDYVFMVGDNPETDIRLAAAAGPPFKSCLVSTGLGKFVCPALRSVSRQDSEGLWLLNDVPNTPDLHFPSLGAFVLALFGNDEQVWAPPVDRRNGKLPAIQWEEDYGLCAP